MAVSSASPPPGRKSMLRNPVTWIVVLGVVVAGGAWILWKRSQNTAASSGVTSDTGASTTTSDGTGTSDAGALGTLQTEIADLQSSEAQETAAGTPPPGGGGTPPPPGGGGGPGPVTAPKAPPVLTVVNPGNAAADISWTGVPGAAGYQVDVTGPEGSQIASPKVPGTHARITLPAGKKNMHVRVRAYNSAGNGPWSLPRVFSVSGTATPPAAKKAA